MINQFGFLVKDRCEELRRSAADLNRMQARRIRADYNDTVRITPEDAKDALRKAATFMNLCAREFGFARSESSPNA